MPITTKQRRASGAGNLTGRRSNAAVATARTDPQINPAGKPTSVNATPPASAMISVSAVSMSVRKAGLAGDIGLPTCPLPAASSNEDGEGIKAAAERVFQSEGIRVKSAAS